MSESWVLDGLSLTNGAPFSVAVDPEITPGPLRAEWVGGPDTDGAVLLEEPHADNTLLAFKLRVARQATGDAAADALRTLSLKLAQAAREGSTGIDLVWTPDGWSYSFTLVVLLGEIVGLPLSSSGSLAGWLKRSPVLDLRLTCKALMYGPWLDVITDDYASNTLGSYTLDSGSGTLTISGGVLVPSSTSDKYLIHTASPYAMENARALAKVTTGASVASGIAGVALKRLDASNHLFGQVTFAGASSVLRIAKNDVGSVSTLASSTTFTAATATSYWVRMRQEGLVLTAELFTAAPTATSSPTKTVTHTLTGGDATKYGTGTVGRAGIRFQPQATDWRMDDLTIEPNVAVSATAALEMLISDVSGDAAAEGKLTITDSAAQARRHLEAGIDPEYDSTAASFIAKASLVTSGFAGIPATLVTVPVAAFGTGVLTHVGGWRAKLIGAQVSSLDVQVRLGYRTGDGQYSFTPWVTPPLEDAECEIDLGLIRIEELDLGTQSWDGRVEAKSATAGDTLSLPNAAAGLLLLPADGGQLKARAPYVYRAGALVARDEFTGITAGTALNARAAPTGGTWATSGAAIDFAAADLPVDVWLPGSPESMTRATTSDSGNRYAVLGSTSYTDTEVGVWVYLTTLATGIDVHQGAIARWVDANNHLRVFTYQSTSGVGYFGYYMVVGGSVTAQRLDIVDRAANSWYQVRVIVYASGLAVGTLMGPTGSFVADVTFQNSALATGGTLATGKPVFFDANLNSGAATRYYDNFYAATPPAEQLIIESGRRLVLTHDTALKESSAGGTYGLLSPRGSRVWVPPAGGDDERSRLVVKARRADVDTVTDANLTDSLTAQLSYRPRYRIPHA